VEPDKTEDISDIERAIQARQPAQLSVPKIGRNDSCPCGSGKKFKKCCAGHAPTDAS
jgi:preprotein translocase subunit SecA